MDWKLPDLHISFNNWLPKSCLELKLRVGWNDWYVSSESRAFTRKSLDRHSAMECYHLREKVNSVVALKPSIKCLFYTVFTGRHETTQRGLVFPSLDYVLEVFSHFNLLDARGNFCNRAGLLYWQEFMSGHGGSPTCRTDEGTWFQLGERGLWLLLGWILNKLIKPTNVWAFFDWSIF